MKEQTVKKVLKVGLDLSEWKIRRIMRENGLYPETIRKFKPHKKAKVTEYTAKTS